MRITFTFLLTLFVIALHSQVTKLTDFTSQQDPYTRLDRYAAGEKFFYFTVADNDTLSIWKTNGATGNTKKVWTQNIFGSNVTDLNVFSDQLLFVSDDLFGYQMIVFDPTEDKFLLPAYTNGSLASSSDFDIIPLDDNRFLFKYTKQGNGEELFVYNKQTGKGELVKDINGTSTGSSISNFFKLGNKGYFTVSPLLQDHLWESDGTPSGTKLVYDFPGVTGWATISIIQYNDEKCYFELKIGNKSELWITDGSTAGTKKIMDSPFRIGQSLIFMDELYVTNYDNNTNLLYKINESLGASELIYTSGIDFPAQISKLTSFNNHIYFIGRSEDGKGVIKFDPITLEAKNIFDFYNRDPTIIPTSKKLLIHGTIDFSVGAEFYSIDDTDKAILISDVNPGSNSFKLYDYKVAENDNIFIIGSDDDEQTKNIFTIINSDIKPFNVKVTLDGELKCADDEVDIVLVAEGGVPPYDYSWVLNQVVGPVWPGAFDGFFSKVTITDAEGEVINLDVSLPALTNIYTFTNPTITAATGNQSDGAILGLDIRGGVPPYTYLWSNGATTLDLINVPGGDYMITVTDSLGCEYMSEFTVPMTSSISIEGYESYSVTPTTAEDNITVRGNSKQQVTYSLASLNGTFVRQNEKISMPSTINISDLPSGQYMIIIQDQNRKYTYRFLKK